MTDLLQAFEQAVEAVKQLDYRPDNDTLLKLYALYKKGSEVDARADQPGFFDFVGTAKHGARVQLRGLPQAEAMRRYIALVDQLQA